MENMPRHKLVKNEVIQFRIDPETKYRFIAECRRHSWNYSVLLRNAIEDFLEKNEVQDPQKSHRLI